MSQRILLAESKPHIDAIVRCVALIEGRFGRSERPDRKLVRLRLRSPRDSRPEPVPSIEV